ncbi:alpha/beta fold hydrolase [Catellatospora sichuanensis]|uniref:alpha/beta fold hydrolase n=1 Tax=Catellatospora sichuanensis TaxID=1969805 RepID=UPI001642981D|nr:alpha/beta fold hydrolase [Catellatospora sichuanensis]
MPLHVTAVAATNTGRAATVREHYWAGYRCHSRIVRSTRPRLAPVLLVGGAFQRKEDWGRLEQGLLTYADVVTVDLPGWGTADLLPETYGVDFLAAALDHILGELGLAQVNVTSGSYGTAIAYRLAQLHPGRVARMVLIGTMTAIPDDAADAFRHTLDLLAAGQMDEFATTTVDLSLTRDIDADITIRRQVLRRILLNRVRTATADEIAKYAANTRRLLNGTLVDFTRPPTQPALVTTGEHDTFTTPRMCRELAGTCPDSWFAVIRNADHLVHMERSAEVVDLMTRFFGDADLTDLPYCTGVHRSGSATSAGPAAGTE